MFLFQQGHGMLKLVEEFAEEYDDLGIILSPKNCNNNQMINWVSKFRRKGLNLFFDPQFYEPRTDLDKISSFPYWPQNFQTVDLDMQVFCNDVIDYQANQLGLSNIIIPGRFTNNITDSWLELNHRLAQTASEYEGGESLTLFSTIALGPDVISNNDLLNSIIDEVVNYPVQGVYLIYEHPRNQFLIQDEVYIYNLLEAILSLSLNRKKVIIGYSNQQTLLFYAAGIEAIATGNFKNVRHFSHENFYYSEPTPIKREPWYFDGKTFGEYRIPQLSLAYRRGLENLFGPETSSTEALLNSDNPASIVWKEKDSFIHYFKLMIDYIDQISTINKNERADHIVEMFENIESNINDLNNNGFDIGFRGFNTSITPTLHALRSFKIDKQVLINSLE